jgi:protein-L-isoaspartate O-methyltransferase
MGPREQVKEADCECYVKIRTTTGAGTCYNAALMAQIVGDQRLVVTVDVLDDAVAQTRRLLALAVYPAIAVLVGDGPGDLEGDRDEQLPGAGGPDQPERLAGQAWQAPEQLGVAG